METKTEDRLSSQEGGANENVANGKENVANDKENVANSNENVANGNQNVSNGNTNVANGNGNVVNSNGNVVNDKENVANGNGDAANETSISFGEDFEIISDDEDNISKDTINQMRKDLDALAKDKLKVTKENEELVETLLIREKNILQLQQQVDWFVKLHTSFINKAETLPAVPIVLSEETQKRLISIHEGMEHTLKDLRPCQDKDTTAISGDLDDDVEVIQMSFVDEGQELTAELEFYRAINKMLTSELEEQKKQGSEFPEVPSTVPEHVQNDLQRHKAAIKSILQKQTSSAKVVEEPLYVGDSITTSFTKVEIKTGEKLDEQNQPTTTDMKGKPELQSQVTQTKEKAETELQSKCTQTDVSFTELEKLFDENNELMHVTANQKMAIQEKDQMVWELENRLKIVTAEKEKALLRISKLAGAKLTEDNPGISDLSDDYRPLKIAEMFSELYDNEWTDALSALMSEMKKSEDDGVQNLLEILQEISVMCQFGVVQQRKNMYIALVLKNESKNTEMTEQEPSKQERRKVNEFQKKMAASFFPQLEQSILENEAFKGPFRKEAHLCQPYIRKCIQLCWMMNVHDPAMELVFEFYPGQNIDEKLIKPYRKRGSKINYLVWPVLLLHHDGPVAQKGIAQPI